MRTTCRHPFPSAALAAADLVEQVQRHLKRDDADKITLKQVVAAWEQRDDNGKSTKSGVLNSTRNRLSSGSLRSTFPILGRHGKPVGGLFLASNSSGEILRMSIASDLVIAKRNAAFTDYFRASGLPTATAD